MLDLCGPLLKKMPTLNINGIEVNFPYEPYACQLDYMKSVLDSIQTVIIDIEIRLCKDLLLIAWNYEKRKNAILESPTGTGKTLCLLCSSISWLLAAKADMQLDVVKNELDEDGGAAKLSIFSSNLVNRSTLSKHCWLYNLISSLHKQTRLLLKATWMMRMAKTRRPIKTSCIRK